MRILYVLYLTSRTGEGVRAKVGAQAGSWIREGHDVSVVCLTPDGFVPQGVPIRVFRSGRAPRRVAATMALAAAVARAGDAVVYLRYDLFVPPLAAVRQPVVLEVNTDDRAEFALRGRAVQLYNRLNRRVAHRLADGAVFVSRELAASPSFARAPALRTVIGNGIDLAAITAVPAPQNERPCLAFVGSDTMWSGVDKVFRLAEALPECDFEVAGVAPNSVGHVPQNVVLHGVVGREEVAGVLRRADVALGTLALHRAGLNESSSLKVREYLAYGVPTVVGNADTDFPGAPPWFLLQLPNDEDNVASGAARIREFATSVRGRRIARSEIAHLDVHGKERERLAFIARVAREADMRSPRQRPRSGRL